jgi:hypothetical protein
MPASLQLAVFGRIALAAGLGYLIGLERQIRGKAAGDRTLIGVLCGAKVDLAAVAHTNPFDPAVSASSGDVWAQSVDPNAPYAPLSLAPGESGTITLTITPHGHKGKMVRGFVDVDTLNLFSLSGDEVTTFPYRYRIG